VAALLEPWYAEQAKEKYKRTVGRPKKSEHKIAQIIRGPQSGDQAARTLRVNRQYVAGDGKNTCRHSPHRPHSDAGDSDMTAKQIKDTIELLNHTKGCMGAAHVTAFECAYDLGKPKRAIVMVFDSGDKVIGTSGEHSRYRCDIKTCEGLDVRTNQNYPDPEPAIRDTVEKLFKIEREAAL
jgi:hypothetical protein